MMASVAAWFHTGTIHIGMPRMIPVKLIFILSNSKGFQCVMGQGSQRGEVGACGEVPYINEQNLN